MKVGKALKWSRVAVSSVVFALLTMLFASVGMQVPAWAGWLARIQLLPAAMALASVVFVGWMIATLLFGRIYCSSVCPLGYVQDGAARLCRGRRKHYRFSVARNMVRYVTLGVLLISVIVGISWVPMLLDPYSTYGRFALNVIRPVWGWLASLFSTEVVRIGVASWLGFGLGTAVVAAVAVLAARHGRIWCNTVCPVGTTLGLVSRHSVFHIDINPDKCILCRQCEAVCKGSCISLPERTVDASRCVVCFNCLTVCNNDAIHYTPSSHRLVTPLMQRVAPPRRTETAVEVRKTIDRRTFLATGLIIAATPLVARAERTLDNLGRFGTIQPAIAPPGVPSRNVFLEKCTGCGLCISRCPTGVLKPSLDEYGIARVLHPVMDYNRARCAWGCTECNNVCPTGALLPLTLEEKRHTAIGTATVIFDDCIGCGRCATACPTGAVTMTYDEAAAEPYPVVDRVRCIGCGACQSVCPARPQRAIIVENI